MRRRAIYPQGFIPVIEFQSEDGKPMKMTCADIVILRPRPSLTGMAIYDPEIIPAMTVLDGCSSPFLPRDARRGAYPHDIRFRNCRGWWAANLTFFRDMRDWDGRNVVICGLFWLALTLFPFAYLRHYLRRRYRWKWLVRYEKRWIPPRGAKAVARVVREEMAEQAAIRGDCA